jgi:hypothetical protein
MPKPRYWGVRADRNYHGRLRWYFRPERNGKRIRLPDDYGSDFFEQCWRAAVTGQPLPVHPCLRLATPQRMSRGKLGWLIRLYLQSQEFQALRPATKRPRFTLLEKLAIDRGHHDIEDIDQAAIQASVNARRDTPHLANVWLATVSQVFGWATREPMEDPKTGGLKPILAANPCVGVKRIALPKSHGPQGHPTFSDEDLAQFEAAYPLGTLERKKPMRCCSTPAFVSATRRSSAGSIFKRTARSESGPKRQGPRSISRSCLRSRRRSLPDRTASRKC